MPSLIPVANRWMWAPNFLAQSSEVSVADENDDGEGPSAPAPLNAPGVAMPPPPPILGFRRGRYL